MSNISILPPEISLWYYCAATFRCVHRKTIIPKKYAIVQTKLKQKQNAEWSFVLLWRRERDSFLIFARRFGFCLLLCRAKIFGHILKILWIFNSKQFIELFCVNNSLGCFVHCVRTPLSPPFRKRKNHLIGWFFFLAEREGFEPSCACAQTDFEKYKECHNPSLCVPDFRKKRRFSRFSSAHLSDFSEKW